MSQQRTNPQEALEARSSDRWISVAIFSLACLLLLFVCALLSTNLLFQHRNYDLAINEALKSNCNSAGIAIAVSRAFDFAVVKTSALFLGFVLSIFGTTFVLHVARSAFRMHAEASRVAKLAFQSTSPGLVIATLGVIVVVVALYNKSLVNLNHDVQGGCSTSAVSMAAGLKMLIPFEPGQKDEISADGEAGLNQIVAFLNAHPEASVSIEGPESAEGVSHDYSLGLAERRANIVNQKLEKSGISADRFSLISYGEERPVPKKGLPLPALPGAVIVWVSMPSTAARQPPRVSSPPAGR